MSAATLDVEVQRGDNDPSGVWQIVDDAGNPVMAPRSAFMLMVIWRGGSIRKGTAGVPGAAHGLRAACARRAAEAGATEALLDALSEWTPGSREVGKVRPTHEPRTMLAWLVRLRTIPHRSTGYGKNRGKRLDLVSQKSSGAQERTRTFTSCKTGT